MTTYRTLRADELSAALFAAFIRRQVVTACWRKTGGAWRIEEVPFVDDWDDEDRRRLVSCLRNTVRTGGLVLGAFIEGRLKGFVSVEAAPLGREREYLDLSSLHVSEDMRRSGMGRRLFESAKTWAAEHGAKKLYISAHSAVESQAFYRAMGCVEASEYCPEHVKAEPCDCQLECAVCCPKPPEGGFPSAAAGQET